MIIDPNLGAVAPIARMDCLSVLIYEYVTVSFLVLSILVSHQSSYGQQFIYDKFRKILLTTLIMVSRYTARLFHEQYKLTFNDSFLYLSVIRPNDC